MLSIVKESSNRLFHLVSTFLNISFKVLSILSTTFLIGASRKFIPKFCAKFCASFLLSLDVITDGILIPKTLSLPRASASNTAQTLESSPPDRPITAFLNPVLLK